MDALLISNIVLWIIILVMSVVIFALTRQVGILYERVAPAGALMLNKQLRVGDAAPEIAVNDLSGKSHVIGKIGDAKRSQLLFFVSPECPICKTLLPVLKSVAASEKNWVDIVLVSDGDSDHKVLIEKERLERFPYIVSELLGVKYGVSKLPYAVLLNEQRHISSMGIINSREHLESLFEAKERSVASIQDYMALPVGEHK